MIISLIILPFERLGWHSTIREYDAFKQTVQEARENGTEIERAAIQQNIAAWNQAIASAKYWDTTVFGIFIPEEVTQLEPLK